MRYLALATAVVLAACSSSGPRLIPLDAAGYSKLIADHKGQILLVDFWATWCEPCLKELPELARLQKRLPGRFKLLAISADEPEQEGEAVKVLLKSGLAPPFFIKRPGEDDAFIRTVDPAWSGALPAVFLYDRQGRRLRSFIGETQTSLIEAALAELR